MRFYVEVKLIDNSKLPIYDLWSKVYTQLHFILVDHATKDKMSPFGISFPEYHVDYRGEEVFGHLGSKFRVFAKTEEELRGLDLASVYSSFKESVEVSPIGPVPENIIGHLNVKRYQSNFNLERLTRRYAKRKGISLEDARLEQIKAHAEANGLSVEDTNGEYFAPVDKDYPYVKFKSKSTNRKFSLKILQVEATKPSDGVYSTYGLSSESTVPHW